MAHVLPNRENSQNEHFLTAGLTSLQAESVLDIIQSETNEELKCALEHLEGKLSLKINEIKDDIKQILAETERLSLTFPKKRLMLIRNNTGRLSRSVHKGIEKVNQILF